MAEFIINFFQGPLKGKIFQLAGKEVSIGRSQDNDIALDDKSLSRNHCKLLIEEENVTILDLGSSNGVYINNKKEVKALLKNGDSVVLGDNYFYFYEKKKFESANEAEDFQNGEVFLNNFSNDSGGLKKQGKKKLTFDFSNAENKRRLILYGGVVLLFSVVIFFSGEDKVNNSSKGNGGKSTEEKLKELDISSEEETLENNLKDLKGFEKIDKTDINRKYQEALLLHDTGKYSEALVLINLILKTEPENSFFKLKKNQWNKERNELALKYYESATLAHSSKYFSEAIEYYTRVLNIIQESGHRLNILSKKGIIEAKKSMEQMQNSYEQ